jgi:beta-glucosidase
LVLVTGLSGAGKASILRVLEDLGFETVDNPPLGVLEELVGDGTLPLAAGAPIAVVGPRADTFQAMLGCYSFPMHVLVHHPGVEAGVEIRTVREALADSFDVTYALGCPVVGGEDADIEAAVAAAAGAEACVVVLGDEAGLFGNGTSGEGNDVATLDLPGRQEELLEALLDTGTPVVAVLLVGRPYDLSRQVDRLAALVCGFFPGEEGAQAVADVLSGRVNPSGRLPVSFPAAGATHPATYLASTLGRRTDVSVVDPTPLFAFGHGISYAGATWGEVKTTSGRQWDTDGACEFVVWLANEADRDVSEVVQVYLHDRSASVVRPVQRLVGAVRVDLAPGERKQVRFGLHADLTSFTGRDLVRIVEPGAVELWVGASSSDIRAVLPLDLVGPVRDVGPGRVLEPDVTVTDG